MAVDLFRRKYRDRNGQERETATWHFYPPGARRPVSTGLRDRKLAQAKAAKLFHEAELVRSGLAPRSRARNTRLDDLVTRYAQELEARDRAPRYIRTAKAQLVVMLEGAERLADVDRDHVYRAIRRVKERRSATTVRAYQRALHAFFAWLVDRGDWPSNPVPGVQEKQTDPTRERRALSEKEVGALLKAAAADRRLAYLVAVRTGLRRGELDGLLWRDLDLDRGFFTVRASTAKSGKLAHLPLHAEAATALRKARGKARGSDRVLAEVPTTEALRGDLEAAGIDYVDDDGRVADFHALRHTFITLLVQAGAPLAMVQKLARHSTPHLTAHFYTHLRAEDLRGALDLMAPKKKRARAKRA